MKETQLRLELAGKTLTLQTGQLARQATASVLARLGDTMILATVVEGKNQRDLGYLPLTVEYIERLYAGGRIKGSRWVKREGRPSDEATLIARLIDRSIRPLFPKEYKNEVQIVVTVLSVDGENEPDILSVVAVSAALSISKIPWNGPIGSIRMGYIKEKDDGGSDFLINPGGAELKLSELNMVVSQTKEKTIMLEVGASSVPEEIILSSLKKAHEENKKIITFIESLVKDVGEKKEPVAQDFLLKETILRIEKFYKEEVLASGEEFGDLIEKIFEKEKENKDLEIDKQRLAKAVEYVLHKNVREQILKNGKRPDGRGIEEIRPITASVSVLPRTHGSALFQRGETQGLTVVTLGSPSLELLIESAEGEESKRYMHHYSMPPYSVGETGRIGFPSRREIGHGALAEKALLPAIPKQEKFPYTIRVVSEILSSNGSTSMAATCGSTLALMDAGVPIEKPVAGLAMGMISNEEKYIILTDITGLEDFSGDMDFKVAGTDTGITAIQLDVKNLGLTMEQIKEVLERAKGSRLFILEKMLSVLPKTRPNLSEFAPKIEVIHIPVEKIGEVIGPGGRVIKNIIAQTGATVDVEDDGAVTVSGTSGETVARAADWIRGITREIAIGEVFEGEVKRILPFGAFVEILPNKEGMVHVSQMSSSFVKSPNDVVSIGQKVKVKVIEIDEQGRINLSMLFETHPLSLQLRRERSTPQTDRKNWRTPMRRPRPPFSKTR